MIDCIRGQVNEDIIYKEMWFLAQDRHSELSFICCIVEKISLWKITPELGDIAMSIVCFWKQVMICRFISGSSLQSW